MVRYKAAIWYSTVYGKVQYSVRRYKLLLCVRFNMLYGIIRKEYGTICYMVRYNIRCCIINTVWRTAMYSLWRGMILYGTAQYVAQ